MSLTVLPGKGEAYLNDAKGVLKDALAENYASVIVFGMKDGIIAHHNSANISKLELIGALEVAKSTVWEAM